MGKKKYVRKHYFINPQFQTRFLVSFIIPMFIFIFFIGVVMFFASRSAIFSAISIVGDDINGLIRSKQMHVVEKNRQNMEIVEQVKEYAAKYAAGDVSNFSGDVLKSTSKVLILGLIIVILELAALTVFVSHKIAGPIYRFEWFSEALSKGNLTERIHLRKGDEMIGTADKFNKMADSIEEKISKLQDTLSDVPENEMKSRIAKARELLNTFKIS